MGLHTARRQRCGDAAGPGDAGDLGETNEGTEEVCVFVVRCGSIFGNAMVRCLTCGVLFMVLTSVFPSLFLFCDPAVVAL